MKLTTMDEDLRIHQKLEDEPNDVGGLSAQALKERFDQAGLSLQKYLNEVHLPEEEQAAAELLCQAQEYADKRVQSLEKGSMQAGIYDPESRRQDVFGYVDGKLAELQAKMGGSCLVFAGTGSFYNNMNTKKVTSFDEMIDPDGLWSAAEKAFVVPEGGKMALVLARIYAAKNQGTEARVHLLVNGAERCMRATPPGYANGTWMTDVVTLPAVVQGGDRLTLTGEAYKESGYTGACQIQITDVCVFVLK